MGLFETMHINADGMEDYCKRFVYKVVYMLFEYVVCLFVCVGSCCCMLFVMLTTFSNSHTVSRNKECRICLPCLTNSHTSSFTQ